MGRAHRVRGVLRVHPENRRYFTDDSGRAILLTGSHTWNNLMDMGRADPAPAFDFENYLDVLEENGHNFIRLWAWDMLSTWDARDHVRPFPWSRSGPGNAIDGLPRFDLTSYDPEYFGRLRKRVAAAGRRGICVSIMLFDGWAVFLANRTALETHLFAKGNNINGIDILGSAGDGILRSWLTLDEPKVVALQRRYIARVIDEVNGFDNVLYEICNEGGELSHDWQESHVRYIRRYESRKAKRHLIGATGGMGTLNRRLWSGPADWVAPEGNASDGFAAEYRWGGYTWGSAPFDRADRPVVLDTDHLWGIGGSRGWAWKSFCRGYHPIYMDRWSDLQGAFYEHPSWTLPADPALRRELGEIRSFADRMDLRRAVPRGELASTAYCLASPGSEYLVYQPEAGAFAVRLEGGSYGLVWHEPESGRTLPARRLRSTGGGGTWLTPPFQGDAVAYFRRTR